MLDADHISFLHANFADDNPTKASIGLPEEVGRGFGDTGLGCAVFCLEPLAVAAGIEAVFGDVSLSLNVGNAVDS